MAILEEMRQKYIAKVFLELKRRGLTAEEIPVVIGKTGFMAALEEFPDGHCSKKIQSRYRLIPCWHIAAKRLLL